MPVRYMFRCERCQQLYYSEDGGNQTCANCLQSNRPVRKVCSLKLYFKVFQLKDRFFIRWYSCLLKRRRGEPQKNDSMLKEVSTAFTY